MLRLSTVDELIFFDQLDLQSHAAKFVAKTGFDTHQEYFDDPNITYLSIDNDEGDVVGYFILVRELHTKSVEFRRILIDQTRLGIGQVVISEMENYCRKNFETERIWLDVYEDNVIGKHIYVKLGYKKFKEQCEAGRTLEFYDKNL